MAISVSSLVPGTWGQCQQVLMAYSIISYLAYHGPFATKGLYVGLLSDKALDVQFLSAMSAHFQHLKSMGAPNLVPSFSALG